MKTVIDKKCLEEKLKSVIGNSFKAFDEKTTQPNSCAIGILENLEDSKWVGRWTEKIRSAIRSIVKDAECVCVMPIPKCGIVWYTIDIA